MNYLSPFSNRFLRNSIISNEYSFRPSSTPSLAMTGNEFYLKLKTKDKNFELRNTLQIRSNLEELRRKISEVTAIPDSNLKILFGYPRKPLGDVYTQTLEECGIKCGDTLFVEEKEPGPSTMEDVTYGPFNAPVASDTLLHITDTAERNGAKGIFLKKEVPSDNSCLFTSINFVLSGTWNLYYLYN